MVVDIPPSMPQSHLACISIESMRQSIPAALILSVLKTENGAVGKANKNKNGTYDYGPMQINTVWIGAISRASGASESITEAAIKNDFCSNIAAGSWILRQKIETAGSLWRGVAHYHSRNEANGTPYAWRVHSNLLHYGGLDSLNLSPGVINFYQKK